MKHHTLISHKTDHCAPRTHSVFRIGHSVPLATLLAGGFFALFCGGCGSREVPVPEPPVIGPALPSRTAEGIRIPRVRFADITAKAGIRFEHTGGALGKKLLAETMGSGVAFIDYDKDGLQD